MTFVDTSSYILTLLAITLAPGPVVLMLMVRAASNDTRGATGFAIGYALGGLAIIVAVCLGLGATLTAVPEILGYSKYLMMAYIVYLARSIWKGGFDMTGTCDAARSGLLPAVGAGLFTCFISPYMLILFPLVLPGLMDITVIAMPDFLIIALSTFAALFAGAMVIVVFAAQLRRLLRNPGHAVTLNRGLSALLVVGGGWMALG